jgi:hypothetical protein
MATASRRTVRAGLILVLLAAVAGTAGCSVNSMIGWGAARMMDGGIAAVYRESDLQLAREGMPAQIMLIESFVEQAPDNTRLRLYAAQAHYSYAFAFIEDEDRERAARLYERAFAHARVALAHAGLRGDVLNLPGEALSREVAALGPEAVPALFWSATALGKWVDTGRADPAVLANGFRAVMLMERVLQLDSDYFFGGPHLFFGAYLASMPAALGGDPVRSRRHFEQARAATQGRLLIVNVLEAQLLSRQIQDREAFHRQLKSVIEAPDGLWPEMAFINAVAREKAARLLTREEVWF